MDTSHVKVADPLHPEYERGFIAGMQMQAQRQANMNDMYTAGWNEGIRSAMSHALTIINCKEFNHSPMVMIATVRDRLERLLK